MTVTKISFPCLVFFHSQNEYKDTCVCPSGKIYLSICQIILPFGQYLLHCLYYYFSSDSSLLFQSSHTLPGCMSGTLSFQGYTDDYQFIFTKYMEWLSLLNTKTVFNQEN